MSKHSKEVSRDTLERLVARAIELDAGHSEGFSLREAREIARNRGVSDDAWNAALAESDRAIEGDQPNSKRTYLQTVLAIGLGFAAGAGAKWLNSTFSGDFDVIYGALLVAAAVILSAHARKQSAEDSEGILDAWWVAIPAGMLVSYGELRTDPLLFAALARWGTGWLSAHLPRVARFFRGADASASTA
jgi:hypothetical protein